MNATSRFLVLILVVFTSLFSVSCAKKNSSNLRSGIVSTVPTTSTDTANTSNTSNLVNGTNTATAVSCQGICEAGYTEVTSQGHKFCLAKSNCTECYGKYSDGYCYQGTYAYQYYYGTH